MPSGISDRAVPVKVLLECAVPILKFVFVIAGARHRRTREDSQSVDP